MLPDGTRSPGSVTFTVAGDTALAIVLENPTTPPPTTPPPTTPPPTTPPPTTPPPTTPTIPNTGANVASASFTGLGLLVVGGLLHALGVRRRRGEHL